MAMFAAIRITACSLAPTLTMRKKSTNLSVDIYLDRSPPEGVCLCSSIRLICDRGEIIPLVGKQPIGAGWWSHTRLTLARGGRVDLFFLFPISLGLELSDTKVYAP